MHASEQRRVPYDHAWTIFHASRLFTLATTVVASHFVFRFAQSHYTFVLIPFVYTGAVLLQFLSIDVAAEGFWRGRSHAHSKPMTLREKLWTEFGMPHRQRTWGSPEEARVAGAMLRGLQARKNEALKRLLITLAVVLGAIATVAAAVIISLRAFS